MYSLERLTTRPLMIDHTWLFLSILMLQMEILIPKYMFIMVALIAFTLWSVKSPTVKTFKLLLSSTVNELTPI